MTTESLPESPAPAESAPPSSTGGPSAPARQPSRLPGQARSIALARAVTRILAGMLPPDAPITVSLEGDPLPALPGGGDPVGHVRVRGTGAARRILAAPTESGFADAYLRGDLDILGDVAGAIAGARAMDPRRLSAADVRRLVRYGWELRRLPDDGAPPREIRRAARLTGRAHSRARDMAAIRFHYDVGESFFRLWLDRRLTYSCAYFDRDIDPARDLDAAQEAKLDLVCRKLDLRPGQRLLDIGCGWGSLVLHAAERYKVRAVGVTLSQRQADESNRRAALMGLEDRVAVEVRDYRDLAPLGPFDAAASIGMFEHVGAAHLPGYFAAVHEALVPGGRFLNHGIATNERGAALTRPPQRSGFVERYVFPDGELVPVEAAIAIARAGSGFDLLDVGLLRPHYALTLRAWVGRLERSWDEAVEAAGEEVARTWRLYMSAARVGFEQGELDVAQLLLARPLAPGAPAPRPLRPWW